MKLKVNLFDACGQSETCTVKGISLESGELWIHTKRGESMILDYEDIKGPSSNGLEEWVHWHDHTKDGNYSIYYVTDFYVVP